MTNPTPDAVLEAAARERTKPAPFPVRPIRMPADLWDRAVAQAEHTGRTGSALVRDALEAYLANPPA